MFTPLLVYHLANVQHVCEGFRWSTAGSPYYILLLDGFRFLRFEEGDGLLNRLTFSFCFTI